MILLIEYILHESDISINFLSLYYNSIQPSSIFSYSFGFVQEYREPICKDGSLDDHFVKKISSTTIAYTPYYQVEFENGVLSYPIILNNYKFGNKFLLNHLSLFKYYIDYSFFECPTYYINVEYIYQDTILYFVYKHPLDLCILPICYEWKLYKVFMTPNHSSMTYDSLYSFIKNLLDSKKLYAQKVRNLVPSELLHFFSHHYQYKFGDNYGTNGSIPSNNGPPSHCADPSDNIN